MRSRHYDTNDIQKEALVQLELGHKQSSGGQDHFLNAQLIILLGTAHFINPPKVEIELLELVLSLPESLLSFPSAVRFNIRVSHSKSDSLSESTESRKTSSVLVEQQAWNGLPSRP
ncbi:hypothetical protein PM082_023594 [Marasmius tenuissimus]|nr:hypothetical protein PM082_023594 [Marasmius tenuissimus]